MLYVFIFILRDCYSINAHKMQPDVLFQYLPFKAEAQKK